METSTKVLVATGAVAVTAAVAASGALKSTGVGTNAELPSANEAARFLTQATWGPTEADIAELQKIGFEGWIEAQKVAPIFSTENHLRQRRATPGVRLEERNFFQEAFFIQAATKSDQLRQRMQFALSQIFVISRTLELIEGNGMYGTAYYYDLLAKNAFGNFRTLLEDVTLAPMMGFFLTHIRSQKEDPAKGRHPDENYAREIMQLMTIGPVLLNQDGSPQLDGEGVPIPSYGHDDIQGLAKVFTGLGLQGNSFFSGPSSSYPKPMVYYAAYHSISEKKFLGTTIPPVASATAQNMASDLRVALDTLFNHPNVGPFIGRRLIQQFVTSNPSPEYISRIAAVFADNGAGVRGDLGAVIKAVLLDPEARDGASTQDDPHFGKLREPLIRLTNWMRAFKAISINGFFEIHRDGNQLTMGTGTPLQLNQAPLCAPSVFNFWRPGYSPPNSFIGEAGLVAPEFQVVTELTAAGYVKYIQAVISGGVGFKPDYSVGDVVSSYSDEVALAATPDALLDRLNSLLFYGRMSSALRQEILTAVNAITIPANNPNTAATAKLNRAKLAIFLAMVSGEYLIQR